MPGRKISSAPENEFCMFFFLIPLILRRENKEECVKAETARRGGVQDS